MKDNQINKIANKLDFRILITTVKAISSNNISSKEINNNKDLGKK